METASTETSGLGVPDSATIRAELREVLASDQFRTAPRLSSFLEYVVERTLAGKSDELKEYRVGLDVFERQGSYDHRTDPVVRVEAGRLRTKLANYYRGDGLDSKLRIEVRKGGYVAVFSAVAPASSVEPGDDAPVVAALAGGQLESKVILPYNRKIGRIRDKAYCYRKRAGYLEKRLAKALRRHSGRESGSGKNA